MASHPAFASAFPAIDEAGWRGLVAKALKGAPFESLVSRSADGIDIRPLYARASDARPLAAAHGGAWTALARIDAPNAAGAREQALADLDNGAAGLHLTLEGAEGAYGFGLPPERDSIDLALDGAPLAAGLALALDAGGQGTRVAGWLEAILASRDITPAQTRILFALDPQREDPSLCAATALRLRAAGHVAPIIVADGRRAHAAGGSEAQELALALAAALAAMRELEATGLELDSARDAIFFRLAADADQFLTMAKLRALRLLWARVEEACGLTPKPVVIHAETAWRMMTRRDPYVNLLRTTTAALAAGLGGADLVSVLPFTQALGLPDPFARRLARNTQLILIEEANLARVADPGAGSGGLEALTREIAAAAWTLFQQVERAGGLHGGLAALADAVAGARADRLRNVAHGRAPLTGTSAFPQLHEAAVEVLRPPRPLPDDALFPAMRLAQDFERLRDRAEAMRRRPRVFLATLGRPADFTARANFARNAFESGGIEAVMQEGDDPASAFAASGARLACLCSSDALYAEQAVDAARALAAKGAVLSLAGRPGALEDAVRHAGVSRFVHAGCDMVELLDEALARAGGAAS